ncbi:MAG: tRNA preQ1(34) S-adenosylmethionine ribosyltransferase-isomerase QueA [Vicinamibacterales bacterium]
MNVADFDFALPDECIAQSPAEPRGSSRLLVMDRATGAVEDTRFTSLSAHLRPGDLMVVNDSRVFPARLLGRRVPSGGAVECLLLARRGHDEWDALVHPGQKLKPGARVAFGGGGDGLEGEVVAMHHFGRRTIRLVSSSGRSADEVIDAIGHMPLPPYIKRDDTTADRSRYQTVYANARGSVAAPTAGLHFTPDVLASLDARGVERVAITLHVGYGTFKPVRSETVEGHTVDPEAYTIGDDAAARVNRALDEGRRVVAVGTTTTRALESAAIVGHGRVSAGTRMADLFIHPGFAFQVLGGLLTNFHLPRSSLLMLVAAFGGREPVLRAYAHAVADGYRFYSYGDAMLVG